MATRVSPLTLYQYADFIRTYRYLAGPTRESAVPINLSGSSVLMEFRMQPTDSSPLISVSTTANAQGVITLESGPLASFPYRISVLIHKAALLALPVVPWPACGYGIVTTDSTGVERLFLEGPVQVIAGYAHG